MMTTLSTSEPTVAPAAPTRRKGLLAWLSMGLLLLGLAGGFLAGRATAPETVLPADLAGPEVTTMLQGYMDAMNLGDAETLQSLFAEDATFTDTTKNGGYTVEGSATIAEGMASLSTTFGWNISDAGTATHNRDYVSWYHLSSSGPAVAVFKLNDEGKIQDMWIVHP